MVSVGQDDASMWSGVDVERVVERVFWWAVVGEVGAVEADMNQLYSAVNVLLCTPQLQEHSARPGWAPKLQRS